jgi:glycerol-3-phosphate dehydrogenase (NAD(P)+)
MGLVMAALLAQQPFAPRVTLWAHDPLAVARLAQTRRGPRLEQVILPDGVHVTGDDAEALRGTDLIISAIPTQFMRPTWERLRGHTPSGVGIVSVSKGFETTTLMRPTEILGAVAGAHRPVAALSGPTIAAELARCLPATLISASEDPLFASMVQRATTTSWLRVYTSNDPLGVEVAGAAKNVIAIAAGILDGLQAGYNAKSALLARGLAEIARLGVALGARQETFFGLAGVGDLATTCFSPEGRNRSLGELLGRGKSLAQALEYTTSVVEGVATTRSVVELARRHAVEMPIAEAVHAVLYEKLDPIDAIARLMSREIKAERVG